VTTEAATGRRTQRIGVVLDAFDASYQSELVKALRSTCRKRRLELCIYPAGILGSPKLSSPQRNMLYDLLTPNGAVDGLVLLGSTIRREPGEVQRWCERLRPLPMCSIGLDLDGVPSLLPDNRTGVRALVRHLVVEHGLRRLAFIGGPNVNQESKERFEAFREELTAQGLDGSAAPFIEGDFLAPSGREAARQLLTRYPLGLDAIVAANDYMAMGVLEVLSTRSSPQDRRIAVTGFDNVGDAAFTVPQLTTVEQPLQRLAEAAVDSLVAQLEGRVVAPLERLDTRLWVRRSCGCKEQAATHGGHRETSSAEPFDVFFARRTPQIALELQRAADGLFNGIPGWERHLLDSLSEQLRGIPGDLFPSAVDRMLTVLLEKRVDVWRFHDVLSVLRAAVGGAIAGQGPKSVEVEDQLHAARLMISAAAMRAQARQHAEVEEVQRTLNRIGARLSGCHDLSSLRAALDDSLPSFGLQRAFLMLNVGASADGTPLARLCYALGSPPETTEIRTTIAAPELLPREIWERTKRPGPAASWVVLPLFSRETVLGFAVVELHGHTGADYETLRLHLSSALATALAPLDTQPAHSLPMTLRSARE
jgi:phosphoserine phosphatase RsbU/P